VVTERQQGGAQPRVLARIGQLANLAAVRGKSVRELVVAVQARQFFDDVDLALDVEAPARDVDQVSILAAGKHRKTETSKDAADFQRTEFFAENPVYFPEVELYRSKVKLAGDYVDHVADELAAAGIENELGNAVGRNDGRFEVGAALKSVRGVGVNAVPLRHPAHRDRVPPRGFDQDVLRAFGDHRVEAAHHAGQSHRLFRISHNQVIGRELALHAIESFKRFAGLSFAND